MKPRAGEGHEIIIKRRSKKGGHDGHGGAWKVAFADFTMAMMALFMVLWIIQPQTQDASRANADQLNNPLVDGGAGIFDGTSTTPLDLDGVPVQVAPRRDPENRARTPQEDPGAALGEGQPGEPRRPHYAESQQMQDLAKLMEALALQLDAEANIEVQVVPQGLRILIKDDAQRFMFSRGSARLDPHFARLLERLAAILAKVDNHLIISGHTDATPYRGVVGGYNNWNLSGDRALRARNVMVEAGLPASTVLQVTAQADGMPLLPKDPENGANRRIELLLLTSQAEGLYRELFGEAQVRVEYRAEGAQLSAPES
ncbi:membrane protein [Ectopseudomonas composti]|uniref:Membrane protein n=1 Tax=Ectopseudomonas composti TaxID=658457 RepID=A0ABP3BS71_9GAMM|nr:MULTISPECIES: flagellar motor protein MotB [Pseudomonas]EZH77552.1 membrane protein [Pseudomonas composti]QNH06552.1 OmpA family protein [Pseudomonas sp. B11D7D]